MNEVFAARRKQAYDLHKSGLSYAKIGKILDVTPTQARNLSNKHEISLLKPAPDEVKSLSSRANNCLRSVGIHNKEELRQAIANGLKIKEIANLGSNTELEIYRWLHG